MCHRCGIRRPKMIGEIARLQQICKDPINQVENFTEAINDSKHMWHLHHKLGLNHTIAELQQADLYRHRPATELIFLCAAAPGEDVYLSHAGAHRDAKANLQAEFEYKCMLDQMGREQCKENSIIGNKMAFESWIESFLVSERIKTRMDNEMLSAATGLTEKFIEELLDS